MKAVVERNDTIDLMKSLAIFMVVICHVGQRIKELPIVLDDFLKLGQLGVQIFFVMTAYLCCVTSRNQVYGNYIKKKYLRLAPAYYFGIIFYVCLFWVVTEIKLPVRIFTNVNAIDIILNFTMFNNLFPSASNSVVPGGWSISCIWIFFLIYPLLNKVISSRKYRFAWFAFRIISYVMVCGIIIARSVVIDNNTYRYFFYMNQSIAFEVGIMLYYLENKFSNKKVLIVTTTSLIAFTIGLFYYKTCSITWIVMPGVAAVAAASLYLLLKNIKIIRIQSWFKGVSNATLSIFIIHPLFAYYGVSYLYKILEKLGIHINSIIMLGICTIACISCSYYISLRLEKMFNIPLMKYKMKNDMADKNIKDK